MAVSTISQPTLRRLPRYLSYLKSLEPNAPEYISATGIAEALGLGQVQVRKDLAQVSNSGRPKVGYVTSQLITEIEAFLGYNNTHDAVIVGAGRLGQALLGHEGFRSYGLNILAAFDVAPEVIGTSDSGKPIFPMDRLDHICRRLNVRIGVITVPVSQAQDVCDKLVAAGIKAIWNFAPTHLYVPEGVLVQTENMAASLAMLSKHLTEAEPVEQENSTKTSSDDASGRERAF
jgi:redox-sensing transcriptional repressor